VQEADRSRRGPAAAVPADGFFTKRTSEAWLRELLHEAQAGTLAGAVRTGATFADAATEWLRFVEHDRACKPTTMRGYRAAVKFEFLRSGATGRSSRSPA
jgi:hypothetical protein